MWEHAASALTGNNLNQTFNIYTGAGSNGKSMFVKPVEKALGDLKGTVHFTYYTKKTGNWCFFIGSCLFKRASLCLHE